MIKKTPASRQIQTLRGRAEEKLKKQEKEDRPAADTDLRKLNNELQVRQIELEMQNEDLHRAQQELEATHSKYVDLYDFAPVGYFTLDRNGVILEANLTGAVMLAKERGLLINKPFALFVASDSQDMFSKYQRQVFSTTEMKTCEIKLKTKDGKEFFGCLESIALEHKGGSRSCKVAVIDISGRKQTEQEIRDARDFFENVFKTIPDGMVLTDNRGYITRVNKAVSAMTGFTGEELTGKHTAELSAQDEKNLKISESLLTNLHKQGFLKNFEAEWLRKDGTAVPVELSITLIKDSDGVTTGSVSVIRDITERKKAEAALRESEAKLRGIIEKSIDSIYLINEQGIVVEWNQGAEKISLLARENAVGRPIWEVLFDFLPDAKKTPVAHERLKQMTLAALQTGQSPWLNTLHEHPVLRRDKTERMIQEYTFPIRTDRGFMLSTISRDITETSQMEEQLRQSQKMESIGMLAGGIAHDFNNILAAIIGNTEIALQILPEYSTAHKHLEQVLKSSDRARNLVKQILAFSRKAEEDREPMEIKKAVTEVIKMLRSTLPATIEIRENITSAAWIMGSVIQMHQVLLNLCTNAFHAMREKGGVLGIDLYDVNIDAGNINVSNDMMSGDYVKLSVIDTGTGIAPEIMNRIFDPFFTTKGVGEGTGMGLSVVYGIVKSHGGDITAESEPGKGTTFHILLPRIEKKAAGKENVEQPVPRGTERILLVEDEEIIADVGQKMLEMLGYRVTAARSGIEALEIFKKGPDAFDLVITDYTMPKMDGYELGQKLMEVRPGMPIIINTGYNETISQEKALAAGIREFLLKPLNLKKLGEVVRRVLDGKAIGKRQ